MKETDRHEDHFKLICRSIKAQGNMWQRKKAILPESTWEDLLKEIGVELSFVRQVTRKTMENPNCRRLCMPDKAIPSQ